MLFIGVILTNLLALQTMQTTISPAIFRAMATLQNQRARAIANTLRARAHYNTARARTNLGLFDHRVIRNSDGQLLGEGPDITESFPFDQGGDVVGSNRGDKLLPQLEDADASFPFMGEQQTVGHALNLGGDRMEFSNVKDNDDRPNPDMIDSYRDMSSTDDDSLRIPLDVDLNQRNNFESNDNVDSQLSQRERSGHALDFQRAFEQTNNPRENSQAGWSQQELVNPTLRSQTPLQFQQGFASNHPQFGQPILINMQPYLPPGVSTMPFLPNGNAFQGYPIQPVPISQFQPGFGSPMIFVRQATPEKKSDLQTRSSQQPDDTIRAANPHLHPFSHSHTHTHTHFKNIQDPYQNIQIPTTQVVTPGINLHVIQNQNAAVSPQQFATATVHPGFNTAGTKIIQVNPDGSIYRPVNPGFASAFTSGSGQTTGHSVTGAGTSASQFQGIQTSLPVNHAGQSIGHVVTGPGISASQSQGIQTSIPTGGNSFAQSQTVFQGRSVHEPVMGMEEVNDEPMEELQKQNLEERPGSMDDEKLGTFMTDFRVRAPESPENFDPNQPRNLQPVVNYIGGHQSDMEKMLQSIQRNENLVHGFGNRLDLGREFGTPNQYDKEDAQLGEGNFEDEKLGTIALENIHLNPPPTLPENFLEQNPDEQRDSIQRYLEEEQDNVKDFLHQVDENNKRALAGLTGLIDSGPELVSDLRDIREHQDNVHREETDSSEITGSPYQYMEPDDIEVEDMLTKFSENDLEKEINDIPADDETNLGHIIDVPDRRETDWYTRFERSLNQTSTDKLDKLLLAEKKVINELKKDAKHDEDLMMIGYIGESMIKDLEKRRNETKRSKREIRDATYNSPLGRLMVDPTTRLDVPKTLANLGTVTKNAFEHEKAPLYHVRNMLGSAQDAVLATMKIPNKNFLIPSEYDIVRRGEDTALVGDINPRFFSERYMQEQNPQDNMPTTFQRVGSVVRDSVLSGQEALTHAGQAANYAKNAVHSTKYAAPKLILKQVPSLSNQPRNKAVLITPRIFDVAEGEQVGSLMDDSQRGFVRLGHILDAIGLSNPNSEDVQLEKIIIEPRNTVSIFKTPDKSKQTKRLQDFLASIRVEDFKDVVDQDEILGSTVTLENARESLGVDSLKDFFTRMKDDLKQFWNGTSHQNNSITHGPTEVEAKPASQNPPFSVHNTQNLDHGIIVSPEDQNQEIVGASMIPENLVHPFMGQLPQKEIDRIWKEEQGKKLGVDHGQQDRNLGQILGAINPMMFERIFNESLNVREFDSPHSVFHHHHDGHSHGFHHVDDYDDEEVGTNMKLSGAMLKPFMGQANGKMKDDFFHKYMPDKGGINDESDEYQKVTETPEWIEVLNPGNQLGY